jgi:4-amino-4-deoxy-L-arabinose transferase-like glycosyltransferase
MNLAVIEMNGQMFLGYIAALAVSGLLLLVTAIAGFRTGTGSRVLSGLFGVGFLGYAIYLFFFFDGTGTVFISYYVFVVPILMIVNVVKSRKAAKEAAEAPQAPQVPTA